MTERRFHSEYLSLAETLYKVAYYILESEDEAEDAVQELYLKLWESRKSLDGIRQPKAYCIRMLKNLCIDRIRSAVHLAFTENLPESPAPRSQDDDFDARRRLDKVLKAVKALPERQKQVLLMRTVEGLSYEEMSARTGMNNATLRVTLSQARTKLKSMI
ncbi:MAG: sigma-70 family RNA polymerase sigma factor [Bacteroidales bacterium]|jgi:RNA polymerase sigma-70 factor (ECF subfamily)|nr:sigma-70 family RNA polymerase sigma factor [Bacteroidales bacterium]MBQ5402197.1 sigma-70 family RNA polymerase sigma factor [Bacteroidales bacterium]MBQ6080999.1 sigma-70 family RNA polymerase sigma factor [Bacteroidales bacterium]MBQ7459662.1 sigma-70 family RNA polymerase sigma factor [Bacteroidales bacterium]MBQ9529214.1 sigma-70 family RNA polymerase sigma factor [Bacteroidales bacterium]